MNELRVDGKWEFQRKGKEGATILDKRIGCPFSFASRGSEDRATDEDVNNPLIEALRKCGEWGS